MVVTRSMTEERTPTRLQPSMESREDESVVWPPESHEPVQPPAPGDNLSPFAEPAHLQQPPPGGFMPPFGLYATTSVERPVQGEMQPGMPRHMQVPPTGMPASYVQCPVSGGHVEAGMSATPMQHPIVVRESQAPPAQKNNMKHEKASKKGSCTASSVKSNLDKLLQLEEIEQMELEIMKRQLKLKKLKAQIADVQEQEELESLSEAESVESTPSRVQEWMDKTTTCDKMPTASYPGKPVATARTTAGATVEAPKQYMRGREPSTRAASPVHAAPQVNMPSRELPSIKQEYTTTAKPECNTREVCTERKESDIQMLAQAIIAATTTQRKQETPPLPVQPPKYLHELPQFTGNTREWLAFKRVYEETAPLFDSVHNMARLRKSIKGSALEAVHSLLFVGMDPNQIIKALEDRFGRPESLVLAEIHKLKALPKIRDELRDTADLATKVYNCTATIQALGKDHSLYSPEIARNIIDKLSTIQKYRWLDFKKAAHEEKPQLLLLNSFLQQELEILADEITAADFDNDRRHEKRQGSPTGKRNRFERPKNVAYATTAADKKQEARYTTTEVCVYCEDGRHRLYECKKFREATVNDRWEFAKKIQACFQCLRLRHCRSECRGSLCKKCSRRHHTLLHQSLPPHGSEKESPKPSTSGKEKTKPKETESANIISSISTTSGNESSRAFLKMIPVEVYGPEGSATVLALLDEGSTVTLLDSTVAAKIGARGPTEPLCIEIVGGKKIVKRDSIRSDLRIRGLHRTDKRKLEDVRTIDQLTLTSQSVDKIILDDCDHLKDIKNQLIYENEQPKLLIGQDNWNLIVSRKVKKGDHKKPVASLTSLGWVLHGPHSSNIKPVNFISFCKGTDQVDCLKTEEEIGNVEKNEDLKKEYTKQIQPLSDNKYSEEASVNPVSEKTWHGDRQPQETAGAPQEYRMTSVTFGAASLPSSAIFKKDFPEAATAVEKNHYMDDYLQSFATEEKAIGIARHVHKIYRSAGFELRECTSNSGRVLRRICEEETTAKEITLGQKKEENTLGLRWNMQEDCLTFNSTMRNTPVEVLECRRPPTKREVTSAVMSTFDPIGLIAPITINGKKLIQELWRSGIGWDEQIHDNHFEYWKKYLKSLEVLKTLKIPRCLAPSMHGGELHTFTDASETAYSAAVYWRTEEPDGRIHTILIAGKARVTPNTPVSMPRLELQAALLGARLASSVEKELDLQVTSKTYWSDSSTVLSWIRADPRTFKPFVAHRLAELEELTEATQWRWVPTAENVADDATRDTPKNFKEDHRWFTGPEFLRQDKEEWPEDRRFKKEENIGEEKKTESTFTVQLSTSVAVPDDTRFSKWWKLLRTMARVLMFIDLCRNKQIVACTRKTTIANTDPTWKPRDRNKEKNKKYCVKKTANENRRNWLPIGSRYLEEAEKILIKKSQQESFKEEIQTLEKESVIEKSNKLKKLDVRLDKDGIMRVGGRIKAARNVSEEVKRPIVLHGKQNITKLIIAHYHEKFCHGNHATVVNELRQRYWILGLRNAVRTILHQCQWCRIHKTAPSKQLMGDLPYERLAHSVRPFTCTAVDYFGPLYITAGRRKEKRWGALFTCLTTRAVHLEIAASLTTDSMIMALRRMCARRGTPHTIYSDNGTNFVGANKELQEELKNIKKQEIILKADEAGIKWKFIPPGAPHMGGAWERMVRSVKTTLSVILQERSPPEEVLHTLMTEVEHTVNSRPLTHLSLDPNDEEALTPNHFLIGRSNGAPRIGNFDERELIRRASWKTAQVLADHFWKRWLKEYLPTLVSRSSQGAETRNPEVGDVVLIVDPSLPRNTWPKGRIVRTYPGSDNRVRTVDVSTTAGILRRPTTKIVVIVPDVASPKNGVSHGGEDVGDEN